MMSFNIKLARQKLPGLSMTDKIELAHLALDEIEALQAQLAARNQAAEAMGVLERLVIAADAKIDEAEGWYVVFGRCGEFCGDGNSLIEAILKAGGEDV